MYRQLCSVTKKLLSRELRTAAGPLREKCVNEVQLLGRVGRDPRKLVLDDDRELVFFDIVTNEVYKTTLDDGSVEQAQQPTWHSIVVKRPGLRDFVTSNVTKGSRVICRGSLQNRDTMTENGQKRKSTSILLSDVVMANEHGSSRNVNQLLEFDDNYD